MLLGILALICASVLFGISPTLTKMLTENGMSPSCVVFLTHTFLMLTNASGAALKRQFCPISGRQAAAMLLSGSIGMGMTSFLLSSSYRCIPVGMATMLHFSYPAIVTLAMLLVFHERLTKGKVTAAACSLTGLFLLVNFDGKGSAEGALYALLSGVVYAFYIIINDRGNFRMLPIHYKMLVIGFGSSAFFGVKSLTEGTLQLPKTNIQWILVAFVGIAAMLGYNGLAYGIRKLGSTASAFATMLEPLTSVLISTAVYRDPITLRIVAGGLMVLVSVLIAALSERKNLERKS